MKTILPHKQSTSQIPSDREPTQALPDPSLTQRLAWTPPSTPPRLHVTPGGGPRPDYRVYRGPLAGATFFACFLALLYHLPLPHAPAKLPAVPPTIASHLNQQPAHALNSVPAPSRRTDADAPVRVFLVAPSVPIAAGD